MDQLTQLGVGGIFCVMVLREVFAFLGKRRNGNGSNGHRRMADQVAGLWRMHDKVDADGVPMWYVPRGLERAIDKLSANLDTQTNVLRDLAVEVREARREIEGIKASCVRHKTTS